MIYENGDESLWFSKFLKKRYKHVSAIKFDGTFWLKIDFGLSYTDFNVLPYDRYDNIKAVLRDQDVSYQYVETVVVRRYRVRSLFALYSCVESVKSLLGIRAWWIVTPWQLFNYLERYHG